MDNRNIQLDLPEEMARLLDSSQCDLSRRIQELLVVDLVRDDRISSGKGAELLAMPKRDFRRLLRKHGVPYFDLKPEELRADIEASKLAEVQRNA